ncbi:uncharacterized protein LOC110024566 [Phalaenopsis equestris]|uniref:uncharacterized protein LOC110024566 n=1 Tax=Phalaenopsis equestris TaxID=78828 RepID=UPI0009E5E7C2|nr:uncharacterized protein LOC110024566 [Phalaenopsis equestris]
MDNDVINEELNEPLMHNTEGDNNVKLSLRSEADSTINSSLRLCDLNEPLKLSSYEEGEVQSFVEDNGSTMEHEEIMRHQLHSDIFLGNWDKVDCFQGRSSSTNLSGEIRSNANGSLTGLCSEEFSVISQSVNNKPEICDKFIFPRQSRSYKSIGETPSQGTDISEGTSKLPNLNSSEFAASQIPALFANLSRLVNSSISVPSNFYSININGEKHTRTSGQLLPSFDFYAANTLSVKQSIEPYGLRKNPAQSNSAEIEQSSSQLKDELPLSLNMDLDGLCDTEAEKGVTAAEEESKVLDYNLIIADKEGDLQLTDGSQEVLIREAADNLVAMSLLICDGHHSHNLTRPSIPTSFSNLHWFADFATSTEANTGISRGTSPHYVDNCLDMFEYMTLKLKETKESELFHKLREDHNYDNTSTVVLPPTRSRKGLVRKRRQRRDFQKDILPGLSSLSRHEISEDIQSFEGIMRASGKLGKTGLSRSRSKKASSWSARGRRKHISLALTVTEVETCSPQKEEESRTTGITTTTILGWGRTTRRCRRARLLPGNLSVSLA